MIQEVSVPISVLEPYYGQKFYVDPLVALLKELYDDDDIDSGPSSRKYVLTDYYLVNYRGWLLEDLKKLESFFVCIPNYVARSYALGDLDYYRVYDRKVVSYFEETDLELKTRVFYKILTE